jgi:hypothetical protein
MADRIEREIEEILRKLDVDEEAASKAPVKKGSGKPPISIESRRKTGPSVSNRLGNAFSVPSVPVSPSSIIILGAVLTLVGFVLSGIGGVMIWVSVVGILMFIAGFVLSLIRRPDALKRTQTNAPKPRWRGREISYETDHTGPLARLKRIFRR